MEIQHFSVYGLHGKKSYEINFSDNKLILVAENGSGKTTLVNIFYYFLSRQWRKLNEFQFEKIIVVISDEKFEFSKQNFKEVVLRQAKMFKRYPSRYQNIVEDIINSYDLSDLSSIPEFIEHITLRYDVPRGLAHEIVSMYRNEDISFDKSKEIQKIEESLSQIFSDTQIVYLPTYRRIEKDLKNIFPELEDKMKEYEYRRRQRIRHEHSPDFIELVEFGMEDVKERVHNRCQQLRGHFYNTFNKKITGSYLEDTLNKRYKDFDPEKIQSFNNEALNYLLKRLDDSIISSSGKETLRSFVEKVRKDGAVSDEDKINAYFVWKLFEIYNEQQNAELDINHFVNICNDYIGNSKYFHYDNDNFQVDIFLKDEGNTPLDYKDLSSGEKQIVSLFSHLILSKQKNFVIIDEPELSLSVPWQERFLNDILNVGDCVGLLAVTHSPFIFRNNLKPYSHSLEEFLTN